MSRPASAAFRRNTEEANVKVVVRCRPANETERASHAANAVTTNSSSNEITINMDPTIDTSRDTSTTGSTNTSKQSLISGSTKTYAFDAVFGPEISQRDLYAESIANLVDEATEGFNCTVFAYGQTGTGKTWTMEGPGVGSSLSGKESDRGSILSGDDDDGDSGIVPRALRQIFKKLTEKQCEFTVKCTFLELYNEEITDLLLEDEDTGSGKAEGTGTTSVGSNPSNPGSTTTSASFKKSSSSAAHEKHGHRLMEDGKGGVSVDGLTEVTVTSVTQALLLARRGSTRRRTAETLCNKVSSRSHSVFSVQINSREPCVDDPSHEGEDVLKSGRLHLVDLAGSENVGKSGVAEKGATARSREAGEINKSLLTLGRVITALVDKLAHVPYRDSKLTRLLRDALGGKSKTIIVATVGPSLSSAEETIATVEYASRARSVRCRPEVNRRVTKTGLVKDLQKEVSVLKKDLAATRAKNGVFLSPERFEERELDLRDKKEKIETLENTLKTLSEQLSEQSDLFADSESKRAGAEGSLEQVRDELTSLKTDAESMAIAFEATAKEADALKSSVSEEKEKREAAELSSNQLTQQQQKTKGETLALFNHAERRRGRIEDVVEEHLKSQKSQNVSAAERLAAAETFLETALVVQKQKKMEREELVKQRRALVFTKAFSEVEKAKAAAVKACDDAMKVLESLRLEVLSSHSDDDESYEQTDAGVDAAYREVAAAASAAREALVAAASIVVPEDTPTGFTPTRSTSSALSVQTPEPESKASRSRVRPRILHESGTVLEPEPGVEVPNSSPTVATAPRSTKKRTSSLPRAPLRKLGENDEETAA